MEKAIEAAVSAGLSRAEAEKIAGGAAKPAAVEAAVELEGGGGDRARGWFELVGWELDEGALRSALALLGADDQAIAGFVDEAAARRAAGRLPEPFKGNRWIEIPHWDEFQHPDAGRSSVLPWIKDFTRQLSDDDYLGLTFHQRGILAGIRLEYARALRQLTDSTSALSRRLGQRVTARDLEALNHAGFLRFSASKPARTPASTPASTEKEKEKKPPTPFGDASKTPPSTAPKSEPLTCPIAYCGIPFKSQAKLDQHLANVHDHDAA